MNIILKMIIFILSFFIINFICYTISYCMQTRTQVDLNISRDLFSLGMIFGFIIFPISLIIILFNKISFSYDSYYDYLDYYFDPKMKGKRILDKQIEEFRKSIKE